MLYSIPATLTMWPGRIRGVQDIFMSQCISLCALWIPLVISHSYETNAIYGDFFQLKMVIVQSYVCLPEGSVFYYLFHRACREVLTGVIVATP